MKTCSQEPEPGTRTGRDAGNAVGAACFRVNDRPKVPRLKRIAQALMGVLIASGVLTGCAFYGFSGASVPSHLNTLAIPLVEDNTTSPVPTLGRDLTSRLTDQFISRTRYSLNNNEADADAVLTARIRQYSNRPTGVSGEERATTNKVEIRVQARYYDQVRDSTMVEQTFTGSAEYDPASGAERQAAQVAVENVTEEIFTTTTSNW